VNNLNSVLIEGVLTSDPELLNQQRVFSFYVDSEQDEIITTVRIEAHGELGETCQKVGVGRGVRIIGQLRNDCLKNKYHIKAEHIEFGQE